MRVDTRVDQRQAAFHLLGLRIVHTEASKFSLLIIPGICGLLLLYRVVTAVGFLFVFLEWEFCSNVLTLTGDVHAPGMCNSRCAMTICTGCCTDRHYVRSVS